MHAVAPALGLAPTNELRVKSRRECVASSERFRLGIGIGIGMHYT